jgi:alpha-N-arabinofuranosidase
LNVPTLADAKQANPALQQLHGSASVSGRTVTLTLVNPDVSEACEPTIVIRGGQVNSATVSTLTHPDIHAQNTFASPDTVSPASSQISVQGSRFTCRLSPASVTRLTLVLQGG